MGVQIKNSFEKYDEIPNDCRGFRPCIQQLDILIMEIRTIWERLPIFIGEWDDTPLPLRQSFGTQTIPVQKKLR